MRYMNPAAKPPKKAPAKPAKPPKMNYGGMAMAEKKPAMMNKGGMPMVEKDGMKVPAFAADGKGKMAKGGMVKGGKPAIALIIGVGKPMAKKK